MRGKTKTEEDLLRIGLFILLDGLVLHEVLSATQRGINSLRSAPPSGIINFLKLECKKIMKINYDPVFALANSVCQSFPTSPDTDRILKKLIDTVLDVLSTGVLLRHDLMGRVYHRLLLRTTGKYYATFYTSIPAASILSNLGVKTPNPDLNWSFENLKSVRELKVLDPACGSGTLLSGVYMALKDKYILDRYNAERPEMLDLNEFHRILLEHVLIGLDILDYAGHLTLTTLALHNPKATFNDSNIYILTAGIKNGEVHLGTLDFLDKQRSLIGKGFGVAPKKKGMAAEREQVIEVPKESIDIVIMNPPFSRSAGTVNIKFGYEEKDIRVRLDKRLREIGKSLGYEGIGQAGLGAYFTVFGSESLKYGGRLALVMPRAILSGVSWEKIRKEVFLKEYEIEYIVSNYDPGDKDLGIEPWNFSENTDLGEVLIVARKTNKPTKERYTTFINLWNKPKNELESLKIVSDSVKARQKQGLRFLEGEGYEVLNLNKEVGVVYNLSQRYLQKNFLIPCLFANPNLNTLLFKLVYGKLVPLVPFEKIATSLGVDRKQVEDSFRLVSHKTTYPILWGLPQSINTMEVRNYDYASPKKQNADSVYAKKGNLLVSGTTYLKNSSITALHTSTPILATVLWEVPLNEEDAKILTLWLNSTFGFLITLGDSISSFGDWFNLKKDQLKNMLVLDLSKLSSRNRQTLLSLFMDIKNIPFKPFPQEFAIACENKGIRKKIDDKFINIFGIEIDLNPYYQMLAKEPIISLKRL